MRRLAAAAGLMMICTLGGCQTDMEPSPAELRASWEQQNIVPQNYKGDLLAFLRTYLNDPSHIRDAAVSPPVRKKVGLGERYVACVRYNARVDGKYAGVKQSAAIYVVGKLDKFLDGPKQSKEFCSDAVFAPFPELEKLSR
ncbi:MAG TPA: hypothetical protein VHV56_12770 [Pseudolabrys sp.]|jgi:hypothetical protein|nr:hypothetical protein [Pseudolabrys sp.]